MMGRLCVIRVDGLVQKRERDPGHPGYPRLSLPASRQPRLSILLPSCMEQAHFYDSVSIKLCDPNFRSEHGDAPILCPKKDTGYIPRWQGPSLNHTS